MSHQKKPPVKKTAPTKGGQKEDKLLYFLAIFRGIRAEFGRNFGGFLATISRRFWLFFWANRVVWEKSLVSFHVYF